MFLLAALLMERMKLNAQNLCSNYWPALETVVSVYALLLSC